MTQEKKRYVRILVAMFILSINNAIAILLDSQTNNYDWLVTE
jgi:hypothetical protein